MISLTSGGGVTMPFVIEKKWQDRDFNLKNMLLAIKKKEKLDTEKTEK